MAEKPDRWRETGRGEKKKKKGRGLFKNESINLWLCDFDREASKDETNIPPRCLFCNAEREHSRRRAQRRSANTDLTPARSSPSSETGG